MILSKWELNMHDYVNECKGNHYKLHQQICGIFDESSVKFDVTIKNLNVIIITQSNKSPVNIPVRGKFNSKEIAINNYSCGTYRIDVNVNAVKQTTTMNGTKKCRTKHAIVGDAVGAWITDRSAKWGIVCSDISIGPTQHNIAYKKSNKITCKSHKVSFTCNVVDDKLFQDMVLNGIGSQKSFGYGLVKVFKVK